MRTRLPYASREALPRLAVLGDSHFRSVTRLAQIVRRALPEQIPNFFLCQYFAWVLYEMHIDSSSR